MAATSPLPAIMLKLASLFFRVNLYPQISPPVCPTSCTMIVLLDECSLRVSNLVEPLEKLEICVMLCAVSQARLGVLYVVERGFSTHRMNTRGANILEFKAKQ